MKSSFCGNIPHIPFIRVDNFEKEYINKTHIRAYFLSHFHGDHIFGLRDVDTRLKRNEDFIYASEVTIAIIEEEYPDYAPYLKPLALGANTVTINNGNEDVYLKVTTLPAGHSLGSVMFLFEYKNKTILYTGDFRITPNSVATYTHLHKNGEPIHIDIMYIDTTFQETASFPKRPDVIRNILVHVREWLDRNDKNRVHFKTSAMYGYESICNEIYSALKIKTYVYGEHKWKVFRRFPKEIYGVTNDPASRIHLDTKLHDVSPQTLVIELSARGYRFNNIDEDFINIDRNRINVIFSTHCARDELVYFVNYFNPDEVVGFPEPFKRASPRKFAAVHFDSTLSFKNSPCKKRKTDSDGNSVGKKVSRDLLKTMFDW